jgi:predicted permease
LLPEYSIPHDVVLAVNGPVLLFSTLVAVVTGILVGLTPALRFSQPQIAKMMQAGSIRTLTGQRSILRTGLIIGQVTLTVLLLTGAGATLRRFLEAYTANMGFDPRNMLVMQLPLPQGSSPGWEQRANYYDALLNKIRTTPGVLGAALSEVSVPPSGHWSQPFEIVGAPQDPSSRASVQFMSADYFSVLKIPFLAGRSLSESEVLRGARLAIVSQGFAQRYLSGQNPIGQQILLPSTDEQLHGVLQAPGKGQPFEIIGMVADVRNYGLHRPAVPQIYVPYTMRMGNGAFFLVKTAVSPQALLGTIALRMRTLDDNQAVSHWFVYEEYLSMFEWAYERFSAVLFATFAGVASGLAVMGLISIVSYSVERRTREFGIRMALGATRRNILFTTLASTALAVGAGLVFGLILSIALNNVTTKWVQSTTKDALVLGIVAVFWLLVAGVSALLPAYRATRIHPMEALRYE